MLKIVSSFIYECFSIRERPFNLKGGRGLCFFFFLNILIPNVAEKDFLRVENDLSQKMDHTDHKKSQVLILLHLQNVPMNYVEIFG